MKIDMQGFDLGGFLEAHRIETLVALPYTSEKYDADEVMHAHDRATTRGLLAVIQGQQSTSATLPVVNSGVAAGSKAARDRAKKAARTRKANIADRQREGIERDAGALGSPATVGGGE